ncbi:MAG: hypothetical protein IJC48_12195, partial [Clostridia bacterium]|nr:hypothetical protein [Clostridia bacterium]
SYGFTNSLLVQPIGCGVNRHNFSRIPLLLIGKKNILYHKFRSTILFFQLAVNNKVWEMRTAFVVGSADIEQDWNTYIEDLKALGMDEVLAIYQEAYDNQYK